jgi:putative transposase
MKKTRHPEEQIAITMKPAETSTRVEDVYRKIGASETTFYNWKNSKVVARFS